MKRLLTFVVSIFSACAVACTSDVPVPLVASNVVVTPPLPGAMMSAGYFTLENKSNADIAITSVASPQFGSVEMHETIVENDIARMRQLEALLIPSGMSVKFERGGKHLMLMQPSTSIDIVSLNFYSDERLLLSVSASMERD